MNPSNDFNIMLLNYAMMYDGGNILDKEKILKSFYHNSDNELYKLNNNFRALRLVGMILESKLKNIEFKQKIKDEIEWILDLQFDDGFFPDSNMEYKIEKNEGVPHLTYHTKIMMCVGLSYLYTKDKRLKQSFFKALKVLLEISIDNYYFFYGRSTNALFGYGTLYLVFILAYKFSSNKLFLDKANSLLKFLKDYQHEDGHVSINLNKDDTKRYGFDGYMYDIVYNAYSNALFLLGNKFLDKLEFEEYSFSLNTSKIKLYKNSGFIVYEKYDTKYCLNIEGHQHSLKHNFDSRVSPFSLLYFKKDKENILPAVGYYPQSILRLVETKFPFRMLYSRLYRYLYFKLLSIFSGNSFYYQRDGISFYPYRYIKMIKLQNKIICKFESKSRELFFKKNKIDFFVISIDLQDNIIYKIIFYKEVDKIIYTYREYINSNKYLKYSFNRIINQEKNINIETSTGMAKLNLCQFDNIHKLEIKVKKNEE